MAHADKMESDDSWVTSILDVEFDRKQPVTQRTENSGMQGATVICIGIGSMCVLSFVYVCCCFLWGVFFFFWGGGGGGACFYLFS